MNKYFYHFTHLDNLDSILKNGLLCTTQKEDFNIRHYNIANKDIQGRRSEMDVICSGKNLGKVHDFVPFYFSTKNTMQLSIINQKKVDQSELIFFGVKTKLIESENFIFTDSSANASVAPHFYDNIADLDKLDWDIINSPKWRLNDTQRQKRMAEVLIKNFKFEYVDHIVVFNEDIKKQVQKILVDNKVKPPTLTYQPVEKKWFFFTKFFFNGRENEDLVTGPKELRETFLQLTKYIISKRKSVKKFNHETIESLLSSLEKKFDCIPETAGIYNLETVNDVHHNTVSDHTLDVVNNLRKNELFRKLDDRGKEILLLSGYLHDIGKGPKSKWKYGKQEAYNDHPYDSLIYTQRVLIDEIEHLTEEEVKLINLLVTYHDILGDLTRGHRNTIELQNIIDKKEELDLLYILSQADILAIRKDWYENLISKFEEIKTKVLK
jgi:hypothetical protein